MQGQNEFNEDEFITQSILRLCSSLEPDIALKNFLNYLKEIMPVVSVSLSFYDRKTRTFLRPGWASLANTKRPPFCVHFPEKLCKEIENETSKDILSCKTTDDLAPLEKKIFIKLFSPFWEEGSHVVNMRIRLHDKYNGGITLFCKKGVYFIEEDIRRLLLLRAPISIVLSNALRYQDLLEIDKKLNAQNQYLQKYIQHNSLPLNL